MTFLLSDDLQGAAELRAQVPGMMVARNCVCGCASFSIHVDPSAPASEWEHGQTPGAMDRARAVDAFLFTDAGRLVGAEITYYDGPALGVPDIAGFRFDYSSE